MSKLEAKADTKTEAGAETGAGDGKPKGAIAAFLAQKPLLLVLYGIIGFGLSFWLILQGTDSEKQFHELKWNTRSIMTDLLSNAMNDSAAIAVFADQVHLTEGLDARKADSLRGSLWKQQQFVLRKIYTQLLSADTGAIEKNFSNKLSLSESFKMADLPLSGSDGIENYSACLPVIYRDTNLVTRLLTKNVTIKAQTFADSDMLMIRYPSFGYWMLSLLLQATLFWLLLPVLCWLVFFDTKTVLPEIKTSTKIGYIVPIILLCSFLYIISIFAAKEINQIVRPVLFMRNLNGMFSGVNILGYFAAALCISGMLFSYIRIGKLMQSAEVALTDESYREKLDAISSRFHIFFITASAILSFAVLATGQFYSALNSLDFAKAVSRTLGYEYFRTEIVYLYAILHSFLLLIFYLPVQMQLMEASKRLKPIAEPIPQDGEPGIAAGGKTPGQVQVVFRRVIDLMVAGFPLISVFLKSLMDLLFE